MRLIHYHKNSTGETTTMIQLSPTRSLPQHMGIMGVIIQDEIWMETQPNHISRDLYSQLILQERPNIHRTVILFIQRGSREQKRRNSLLLSLQNQKSSSRWVIFTHQTLPPLKSTWGDFSPLYLFIYTFNYFVYFIKRPFLKEVF